MNARSAGLAALIAVVVLAATGCRGKDHIDPQALAHELPAAVVADHPEVVTGVSCPGPIPRRAGAQTVCTGAIGGTGVALQVTQLDRDGHVRVQVDHTLLDVGKVAGDLATRLTDEVGVATTVSCAGPPVRVLTVGDTLACTAKDPSGATRTFDTVVADESGTLRLSLR